MESVGDPVYEYRNYPELKTWSLLLAARILWTFMGFCLSHMKPLSRPPVMERAGVSRACVNVLEGPGGPGLPGRPGSPGEPGEPSVP